MHRGRLWVSGSHRCQQSVSRDPMRSQGPMRPPSPTHHTVWCIRKGQKTKAEKGGKGQRQRGANPEDTALLHSASCLDQILEYQE